MPLKGPKTEEAWMRGWLSYPPRGKFGGISLKRNYVTGGIVDFFGPRFKVAATVTVLFLLYMADAISLILDPTDQFAYRFGHFSHFPPRVFVNVRLAPVMRHSLATAGEDTALGCKRLGLSSRLELGLGGRRMCLMAIDNQVWSTRLQHQTHISKGRDRNQRRDRKLNPEFAMLCYALYEIKYQTCLNLAVPFQYSRIRTSVSPKHPIH